MPAPATVFPEPAAVDGVQALAETAAFLSVGPRVSGTEGAARAAAYLMERLRQAGWEARLDLFEDATPAGPLLFRNVVALPPGTPATSLTGFLGASDRAAVILLSHYDTRAGISDRFIGANDSGSSTGLLLHLAALLGRAAALPYPVVLAFVDGEECREQYGPTDGLHGSRRLARLLAASGTSDRVRAVLVLDMVGDRDLAIRLPRNSDPGLVREVLAAAQDTGDRLRFGLADHGMVDDHVPFLESGIPAIDLIDFRYGSAAGLNDYWHTPADTLDKLSADSLAVVGRVTLRTLQRLAAP